MKIRKTETNYKRNLYLKTTKVKASQYEETIENQIINVYPEVEYQNFIGFGGAITQAVGVAYSKYTDNIEVTAFKNIDKSISIILLNRNDKNYEYNLCIDDIYLHDNLDSHAIVSYLYSN